MSDALKTMEVTLSLIRCSPANYRRAVVKRFFSRLYGFFAILSNTYSVSVESSSRNR